jgi:NTP pyrophosphatase (non-canonical NTP hydrolase)
VEVDVMDKPMEVESLEDLQAEVAKWREKQPWAGGSLVESTLGLAEEAGEVCRAVLKQEQAIRGSWADWQEEIEKELGDVIIKACDVASTAGIDLTGAVIERWAGVRKRNFTDFPKNGLTE